MGAPGYRPFVSNNAAFEVPASLAMTEGVASRGTTQTFHFDAHLLPQDLLSPPVTVRIEKSAAVIATPAPARARASGKLRLGPTTLSTLERVTANSDQRRWFNDEDLLNQTVTMTFADGLAEVPEGALAYGVAYELAIFDVDGYQPWIGSSSLQQTLLAGAVSSLVVTVQVEAKTPLQVIGTTADACVPPAPTVNDYRAVIDVTFSEEIEPAGATFNEDIDNGLSITTGTTGSTFGICPLNVSRCHPPRAGHAGDHQRSGPDAGLQSGRRDQHHHRRWHDLHGTGGDQRGDLRKPGECLRAAEERARAQAQHLLDAGRGPGAALGGELSLLSAAGQPVLRRRHEEIAAGWSIRGLGSLVGLRLIDAARAFVRAGRDRRLRLPRVRRVAAP